ncbi:phosphosugar isomerase [Klebsiella pneumoniae subsp. pneumoniae]|nr:phosphosugar isomerase [Klebsiella pneumoniae subsp. pneumoniae]
MLPVMNFVHATPNALGKNSVVILASQQGNTAETVEAARIARQKGAATIGLVYTPGTPLCEHSDYTIEYCWARYPETVDPTQQKAAYSLWLALEVLAQTEGYAHYDEMVSAFASFESVVRGAQQQVQADARHFAEAWKTEKVIYMMGSGPSFGAAHQESICILLEMQWINSASIHSGEYFHGPFEITETGTPFILLKSSGRTRPLDDRAIRFIERYQGKLQIIDVEKGGNRRTARQRARIFLRPAAQLRTGCLQPGAGHRSQPPADHPPLYVESRILIR